MAVAEPGGLRTVQLRRHHRALLDELRGGEVPVLVDLAEGAGAARLTVVTHDRRGLLAILTACFDELGLDVVAADVFSLPVSPRIALDVFRVVSRDPRQQQGPQREFEAQIQDHLAQKLSSVADAETTTSLREPLPPLPNRPRGRARRAKTKVRFFEDPGGTRTVVDLHTIQNPGVMARVCRAISSLGLDIDIARINTELGRVEAVFYVSKLDEDRQALLDQAIRANLRTRR